MQAGASSGAQWIGRVLDARYKIEEEIGAGGMGRVFRATQIAVPRPVAVKVLRNDLRSETALKRFAIEAKIVAELRHPAILKLIDYGQTEEGELYMVTELLQGHSLQDILLAGPFGLSETKELLRQVADALVEAHERGIVHRDLKPANLFIETVADRMRVRVLDFGIAKLVEQEGLTRSGVVFGTPAFLAPEQAKGEAVDGRTDLYSLGLVAYLCLAGRLPFTGRSTPALLYEQVHTLPPDLPVAVRRAEPELVAAVARLLQKLPDDRYENAAALRNSMEELGAGAGPVSILTGVAAGVTASTPTLTHADSGVQLLAESDSPAATKPRRTLMGWGVFAVVLAGAAFALTYDRPAPVGPGLRLATPVAPVAPVALAAETSSPAIHLADPTPPPAKKVRRPRKRRRPVPAKPVPKPVAPRPVAPKPVAPEGFIPVLSGTTK